MSDPIIYSCDHYIVIEPGKKEISLTEKETLFWLEEWLNKIEKLPVDLKEEHNKKTAAKRLLDTACDLKIKPGFTIQWFAIRIEPPRY